MALTLPTAAEVAVIYPNTHATAIVDEFIEDAAALAEQCQSVVDSSATLQAKIVKWIAAHMIHLTLEGGATGSLISQKLGDAQDTYSSTVYGEGLDSTPYGRTAIQLEGTGCLKNLGRVKATMEMF